MIIHSNNNKHTHRWQGNMNNFEYPRSHFFPCQTKISPNKTGQSNAYGKWYMGFKDAEVEYLSTQDKKG